MAKLSLLSVAGMALLAPGVIFAQTASTSSGQAPFTDSVLCLTYDADRFDVSVAAAYLAVIYS